MVDKFNCHFRGVNYVAFILFLMENPLSKQCKCHVSSDLLVNRDNFKGLYSIQLLYFAEGMDEFMTCDFTSFSTVFQLYEDDGRMIMKGCVQWNPVCS